MKVNPATCPHSDIDVDEGEKYCVNCGYVLGRVEDEEDWL